MERLGVEIKLIEVKGATKLDLKKIEDKINELLNPNQALWDNMACSRCDY